MSLFLPARTSAPAKPVVIREATGLVDADDHLYRNAGGAYRDLLGATLWRAQELCVHLYRTNPLANRIVKIYTTYMAGTGFTTKVHNPDVQAVVDEFWQAPRNGLERNHRGYSRDFLLFGEGLHPVAADDTGNTTVGFIDPSRIDRIERDGRNNMILDTVHLQRSFTTSPDDTLQIVRVNDDVFDDAAGLLEGEIFAWLHDRIGAATRGTPYLLPAIDWLDAYDQTLWELLERVKAVRAFFWDVAVQGGADEVREAQEIWGTSPPRSGSVRFRTNAMEVDATQPQIGAYEDVTAARLILRHIASAAGVAPHWLGDPEDANRSTAESMDQPVLRALEDTQTEWKLNMTELVQYAVDRKVAAGFLPRIVERHDENGRPTGDMVPARSTVELVVPAIADDDVTAAAAALGTVATAFGALDMIGAAETNVIRRVVRQLLPALGVPADELPEPEDDDPNGPATRAEIEALESITRAGERGKLGTLLEELSKVD